MNEEVIYPSMVIRSQAEAIELLEQENQELKLELSGYRQAILEDKDMLGLKEENQDLKKQLEENKKYKEVIDKLEKYIRLIVSEEEFIETEHYVELLDILKEVE